MADWYANLSWLPANYHLHVYAAEGALDAPGNESDVQVIGWIEKKTGSGYFTSNANATYSASVNGSTVASGTWSPYDFSAYSSLLLFNVTVPVVHNPDGSKTVPISVSVNDPNNMGSAAVSQSLTLTTLTQKPGVPTGVVGTYVSDSSIDLSWTNNFATNGVPTQNTIYKATNEGPFGSPVTIAVAESVSLGALANRKYQFKVTAKNSAGSSSQSVASAPVFTTPAAPSSVLAAKDTTLDIEVSWTPNVAFTEHTHIVEHGTVTGGVTTWDGSPLASVTAGTSNFKHVSPDPSKVHVYRVSAKNTDTGALQSTKSLSNQVQLLVAPNKPAVPALGPYADKGRDLEFPWVHNPVDTTAQTAYEVGYSTNGGSSWSSTGKVTSTTSQHAFAADTYTSGQQLTLRVRTWGQATSGGSDGTGASPWSDPITVTFKTRPVVTVTSPTAIADYEQAALNVQLGFSQVEGATFVSATISLYDDAANLLEQRLSNTLASTVLNTRVANGGTYTVKVTALDSNGLTSDEVSVTFDVAYTEPPAAIVVATYLEDSGIGQLGLTIPAPGVGEVAAVAVTVTRTINGSAEVIVEAYPAAPSLTILDMTPTVHGDNDYVVTTISADGATTEVLVTMTTTEGHWAFISTGAGFTQIVKFGDNLRLAAAPAAAASLVQAAGRSRPIGLYGMTGDLQVSGSATLVAGYGSTAEEIEQLLLTATKVCYRDPSGRRMFGQVRGQVTRDNAAVAAIAFTVTETS